MRRELGSMMMTRPPTLMTQQPRQAGTIRTISAGLSTSSYCAGTTTPTPIEKPPLGADRMFPVVDDWRSGVRCSFEMFTEPVEVDRSPEAPALSAPVGSAVPLVPAFWSDAAPLVSVVPAFWPDA